MTKETHPRDEQAKLEQMGVTLHDNVMELAKTGSGIYHPQDIPNLSVGVMYDLDTGISRLTVFRGAIIPFLWRWRVLIGRDELFQRHI